MGCARGFALVERAAVSIHQLDELTSQHLRYRYDIAYRLYRIEENR